MVTAVLLYNNLEVTEYGYKVPKGVISIDLEDSLRSCFDISKDYYTNKKYNAGQFKLYQNKFKQFIDKYKDYRISTKNDVNKLQAKFKFPYTVETVELELSPLQSLAIKKIFRNKQKSKFIKFVNSYGNAIRDLAYDDEVLKVEIYNTPLDKTYDRSVLESILLKYGFIHFFKYSKDLVDLGHTYDIAVNELTTLDVYDTENFGEIILKHDYMVYEPVTSVQILANAFITIAESIFKVKYKGKIYDILINYHNGDYVFAKDSEHYTEYWKYWNGDLQAIFGKGITITKEIRSILTKVTDSIYVDKRSSTPNYTIIHLKSYAQAVDFVGNDFSFVSLFDY